jgi:hypothetical protein
MLKPIREYEYSFREGLKEILLNRKEPYLYLSANPNAIPILEKNLDKVNFDCLSENPMLFLFWKRIWIKWIGMNFPKIQTLYIFWRIIWIKFPGIFYPKIQTQFLLWKRII